MAVIFFVKFVASFSSWLCVTDYPILASLVPNATMQSMPPLVCKTENLAERIRFQQQEVDLLKKEIFGTDKIPRSAYIRRFLSEFAEVQALVSYEDLIEAARKSRIIYVGDYHASKKYQQFQARLLEDLAREPILLALEMLYGRNQRALDDWAAGRITEDQFLRRTRYELEWGYEWDGYRGILELARKQRIPIFGIDCAPRDDLRYISKRDTAVAAKIADLLSRFPQHRLMVCFGESHLASPHLPLKVSRHFPPRRAPRHITVLQNIDEIYWKLACDGFEGEQVARLDGSVYCVLNATPFEKYEAYRRQLEIWRAHDQEDQKLDLSSTVYNVINAIADFMRVKKYDLCLTREGVCLELFIDAYPEVYSFGEFDDFEALLQSSALSKIQIQKIINHTMRRGSCYVPRVNAIFIGKFDLTHAAEEAAHFVNFALKRQRNDAYRREELTQGAEFYLTTLEEALGYFGAKLIDPSRDHLQESPILNWERVEAPMKRLLGVSGAEVRWMRRFIQEHKRLEHNYGTMRKIPKIVHRGIESRGRVFTLLTHDLGYLLGEQLYRGYLGGIFSRREISRLFKRRFEEEGSPAKAYVDIAERCAPLWD